MSAGGSVLLIGNCYACGAAAVETDPERCTTIQVANDTNLPADLIVVDGKPGKRVPPPNKDTRTEMLCRTCQDKLAAGEVLGLARTPEDDGWYLAFGDPPPTAA